ncbi:hypothetical protein [uncultured Cytophaga sp.]|uniref:hypothetical protein n=1 Tax=uncultured Cytophaga sp. TaxID=160238 RepID=UPI002618CD8C|nr:hypothetical protein [uncultured Cytophaga sp.]
MKYFILLIHLLFFQILFAQVKTEELSLEKGNYILNTLQVPNNGGLIIKTGKKGFNTKDLNWKLNYYSPEMKLVYSVPLEKNQINKDFRNFLIASTNSKHIYHIEPKGYNTTMGVGSFFVTQINETGAKKTFELDNIKDLGDKKAVFADSKYFYYFTSLKVKNEVTKKKDVSNSLVRVSASDFSKTNISLKLPPLRDEDKSTEWNYSGNFDNAIYFTSKTLLEDGTYIYDIILIDNTGKTTKNFSIDAKLATNIPRASNNNKYFYWADFDDDDFNSRTAQNSVYDTYGITYYTTEALAKYGALGDITFDPKNNAIYIYGLCGPGAYKINNYNCPTKAWFIQKYDINGKQLWKKEYDFSESLQNNLYLKGSSFPYRRALNLNISNPALLTFQVKSIKSIYSYNVEPGTGNITKTYSNEFNSLLFTTFSTTYDPTVSSTLNTFLSKRDPKAKDVYYLGFDFGPNDIVIEDQVKLNVIKLNYFK